MIGKINFSREFFYTYLGNRKFLVAMRIGETPVLIPNTMVKTFAADGTMLETAWESRWLPDDKKVKSDEI